MKKEDLEYLKEFCEFAEDKLTDTDIRAFQRSTGTDGLPHEVLNRYLFESDIKDSASELRKVGFSISELVSRLKGINPSPIKDIAVFSPNIINFIELSSVSIHNFIRIENISDIRGIIFDEVIELDGWDYYGKYKDAYAVSIHKSQGLTFDEVTLDLTQPCFAKGQLYVGLSRVTSPEGLTIITKQTP